MNPNETELIQRVQKHDDRHAFAYLVKVYQSEIRNSLRRFCHGDEALADDLAQETFLKVYRSIQSFRGDSSFRTWLYQIAYRTFLSHQRKFRPETEEIDEHHIVAEEKHEGEAFMRDYDTALQQLSAAQREAVYLTLQRGFAYQEIADIMNLPIGTVKTHILRGKKKLQSLLTDWKEEYANES